MIIRDTSSLIVDGVSNEDVYTDGVLIEVRCYPELLKEIYSRLACGYVEILTIPENTETALIRQTILSLSAKYKIKPSAVDIEVSVAGIIRNLPVASYDRDINWIMFHYYVLFNQRDIDKIRYYGAAVLNDNRKTGEEINLLKRFDIYRV
ncbi:MAG: hypothetical protein QXM68_04320 [Candidatus Aenigmatarchaeota archaeon]|nr:hypothetical protein [Candidatus Aenigmarchaeota archaeon]